MSGTNIKDRNGRRVVPMKVLVLGAPRTGTESMRSALRQLGYHDVYHAASALFEHPRDLDMWIDALNAKFKGKGKPFGREEWDQLLGHCEAVTDVPCVCFGPELIEAYPEAQVILTMRDVDAWHISMTESLIKPFYLPWMQAIFYLMELTHSRYRLIRPVLTIVWEDFFRGFDANGRQVFYEHYDLIRSHVPRDNLLEFRVQEGWEPLCKFLGQPVPVDEFPTLNNRDAVGAKIKAFKAEQLKGIGFKAAWGLAGVVAVAAVVWKVFW